MTTSIDYNREFIVTWKVNYSSLECKNGVHDIIEVEKGTQSKVLNGDKELLQESFFVEQILTLSELLKQSNWESICEFIMDEIISFDRSERIEETEGIEEYLQMVYTDDVCFFYERKEIWGSMTEETSVYYVTEDKVDEETLEILKQIDFTGNVLELKGKKH